MHGPVRGRSRGLALILCLLVLAMVLVLAQAMGTIGMQHLEVVRSDYYDRVSAYAAEAGVARALHELKADSTWSAGFSNEGLTDFTRSAYSVDVTNNASGGSAALAPDGTSVPAGKIYLLATGTCLDGKYPRKSAVMLSGGSFFPYAVASGGNLNIQGSADITGTVRSAGSMTFGGSVRITPDDSRGRLLSGGSITAGSTVTLESDQDVRAREDINEVEDIRGTTLIYPNDTTSDTDPWEEGNPLPEPDVDELLAPGTYVEHTGATTYRRGDTLDLGGTTHYFPDGVSFGNGSQITGRGNIVVGNGNAAVFNTPLNNQMNVIALDSDDGNASDASVEFFQSGQIEGVVYCQGTITFHARVDVVGAIIAYGLGNVEQIQGSASFQVERALPAFPLPGFDGLFGGGGSSAGFDIDSWLRL